MMAHMKSSLTSNLAELRASRGLAAAQLARLVGVTRQTVYAMEAGDYAPNTLVALRLARALEVRVEDLFALNDEAPIAESRLEPVMVLPGAGSARADQPVQLCRVGDRLMATLPFPLPWHLPASDAVVTGTAGGRGKATIRLLTGSGDFQDRVLVAGCDPGISVLARHVQGAGGQLVLAHQNSSQALQLLKEGRVHVAGTHLTDDTSGESNLPEIARVFPRNATASRKSIAVFSFATWEQGIVMRRGNPKGIRGIEDLARRDVGFVNREKGSGSRRLLDSRLKRARIRGKQVRGYHDMASGHLPAAWQVQSGAADCCIATRAAANVFGLDFIPLARERYDLAIHRRHLDLPGIQVLLDTLNRLPFRRELERSGGYDAESAGRRML